MKTVAIIQARMGSNRLPGKVLRPILGKPMLWYIVRRVRAVPLIDEVVVAIPDGPTDEELRKFCAANDIAHFSGSELDVLDRFYRAAQQHSADPVLRITADCPLVDPELVEKLISKYRSGGYDYAAVSAGADASRTEGGCFPDGMDAECFNFASLEKAWKEAQDPRDREHVTRFIWRRKGLFRCTKLMADREYHHLRLTVDYPQDFEVASRIYKRLFREDRIFHLSDIVDLLEREPEIIKPNEHLVEGQHYRAVLEE
ncbi:MAG: glycosyltransferase family protein [Acidobacteriia bacterium]|nr:glycosyltransferase family protein [Terriglobia bacterium]